MNRSQWPMLAVVLGGAVALAGSPARAQDLSKARMFLGIVATEQNDKAAFDDAKAFFAKVKDDKEKQKTEQTRVDKGEPPSFPAAKTVKPAAAALTPEQAAALAALPRLTLGEAILAAMLQAAAKAPADKTAAPGYRWARLRDREMRLLGLDEAAKDKKAQDEAAKAREANEPVYHPVRRWVLYSRAGKTKGAVEFFVLVREPGKGEAVTDEDLQQVRFIADEVRPSVVVQFLPAAVERLKRFTETNQPKKPVYSFMAVVAGPNVLDIAAVGDVIDDGRLRVGANRLRSETEQIARDLQPLVPKPKPPK